ncbi:hypothetical protein POM88_022296 [Heracleum sosnowskyi]|uniref:Reverse transcriptase n=1 Tax=Heracleum sosnowskyi TaxID=360622 RepID=A0AAD8IFL7_9APIA|nr:hypothetical protein POM88_022296 [Heracleum sosnowskyi]
MSKLSESNYPTHWKAIKDEEKRLNALWEKEEIYWRQRNRALWLKSGDKNTKYFFTKASIRKKKNEVKGLIDNEGTWQEDEAIIQRIIVRYFDNLFRSSKPNACDIYEVVNCVEPKISDEMNDYLLKDFVEDDILNVVKEMNPSKSPGIVGLPASFYQKYWSVVKHDVTTVCLNIRKGGFLQYKRGSLMRPPLLCGLAHLGEANIFLLGPLVVVSKHDDT